MWTTATCVLIFGRSEENLPRIPCSVTIVLEVHIIGCSTVALLKAFSFVSIPVGPCTQLTCSHPETNMPYGIFNWNHRRSR